MLEVSPKNITYLRVKTGCGMIQCKKAIIFSNEHFEGNMEACNQYLRYHGLAFYTTQSDVEWVRNKLNQLKKGAKDDGEKTEKE